MQPDLNTLTTHLAHALDLAKATEGRTTPNPPVAALALNEKGEIIVGAVHEGAGTPHAEAILIQKLKTFHTLVVTLEPCTHQGQTPPCVDAIIAANIRRVIIGTSDPNPKAAGGADKLRKAGIEVIEDLLPEAAEELIAPFKKRITQNQAFFTLKQALRETDEGWTMLAEPGQKTFTSPASLTFAHELRKQSDAILTTANTIIADDPSFTVRHVPDHPKFSAKEAKRHLIYLDSQNRVSQEWQQKAAQNFHLHQAKSLDHALEIMANLPLLRVLIEAGPTLTQHMLDHNLVDEHIVIKHFLNAEQPDDIIVNKL